MRKRVIYGSGIGLLIILIACIVGFVVIAMFAPMIALISAVSGPQKN